MLSLEILEGFDWLIGWMACLVRRSGFGALEK